MTKLQEYLIKLLKEIDEICVANDIDYYIFAGSMLGIERNEGILPWDDDIDLIMTKKNYDRFSALMEKDAPPNRVFETVENNKEYPLQFGRYVSTETSNITRSLAFGNNDSGIWIDIMYAVPMPRTVRKIKKIKNWFSCYCELENEIYVEHKNRYRGFFWRYRLGKILISLFGRETVIRYLKKSFDCHSEEDCESYLLYHALNTDFKTYDKKYFEKPIRRTFGGIEVNVSPHNREFCRAGYGDSWMIVPEEQDQETHTVILDFEIPYRKYREDYMARLKEPQVLADIKKTKDAQITSLHKEQKTMREKNLLKGVLFANRFENEIHAQGIDLTLETCDYEKIGELYQDYMNLQFSKSYLNWDSFVPLKDALLYPILAKLVYYDGQYYRADKILSLREKAGKAARCEEIDGLKQMILLCRELSVAIWDLQDYEKAQHILKKASELTAQNQMCADLEIGKLYVDFYHASDRNTYDKVKDKAQHLAERFPMRGECMKIAADVALVSGNKMEAAELYEKAAVTTRNGLILLDIEKKKKECGCYER